MRKTESKLRASQLSNQLAETTNCSYNQYGMIDGGTSTSLGTQGANGYRQVRVEPAGVEYQFR